MILQHQRVLLAPHRSRQRFLFGLIQHDAVEIMVTDPLEQLAALLHHGDNFNVQRGNRLAERLMRVHHTVKIVRPRPVNCRMNDVAGSVHWPVVVGHLVAV